MFTTHETSVTTRLSLNIDTIKSIKFEFITFVLTIFYVLQSVFLSLYFMLKYWINDVKIKKKE